MSSIKESTPQTNDGKFKMKITEKNILINLEEYS